MSRPTDEQFRHDRVMEAMEEQTAVIVRCAHGIEVLLQCLQRIEERLAEIGAMIETRSTGGGS